MERKSIRRLTTGTPWLKVNPNFTEINVERELANPDSIYHYYKKLIDLRRNNDTLIYGSYELILEEHSQVFAYVRRFKEELYLIITNLFDQTAKVDMPRQLVERQAELKLSNYQTENSGQLLELMTLQPYEARVYRLQ